MLLTNSGSEATYAALRLARAVTGRTLDRQVPGHLPRLARRGADERDQPRRRRSAQQDPLSLGMLPEAVEQTIVLPFNDVEAVPRSCWQQGDEIAAVLVEVIPHNIGCVLPTAGVPDRRCERRRGGTASLLIFDEVITGFRHDLGGYQKIAA